MIFFFVPETKQRTLEELDYIFAVPLRKFMSYQTGTWLPWWIKRYVLFQKSAQLQPLYQFENVKENLKDKHVRGSVSAQGGVVGGGGVGGARQRDSSSENEGEVTRKDHA